MALLLGIWLPQISKQVIAHMCFEENVYYKCVDFYVFLCAATVKIQVQV